MEQWSSRQRDQGNYDAQHRDGGDESIISSRVAGPQNVWTTGPNDCELFVRLREPEQSII